MRSNGYSQARFLEKDKEIPESLMFFCEMAAADIPHRKMDGTSRATDACRPPLILAFKSSNQLQSRRDRAPPLLSVEMGFYVDISWESRCNIQINV